MGRQRQRELQMDKGINTRPTPDVNSHRHQHCKIFPSHTIWYAYSGRCKMHTHWHAYTHVRQAGIHTRVNKLSDVKYSANKRKWVALINWCALMDWCVRTLANNTWSNEQVAPKVTSACWATEMDAASDDCKRAQVKMYQCVSMCTHVTVCAFWKFVRELGGGLGFIFWNAWPESSRGHHKCPRLFMWSLQHQTICVPINTE